MSKVLILFAHPRFEKSRNHRALLAGIERVEGVTINDLYEQYPDFNVDADREKSLLTEHDVLVWHFPFYMYGAPALLKQWMDVALEYGWARGSGGDALAGKIAFVAVTLGGARDSYAPGRQHQYALCEFLLPFAQTAALCGMIYLPPFAVHGTHRLTDRQLAEHVSSYHRLLRRMTAGGLPLESILQYDYLNDWLLSEEERS